MKVRSTGRIEEMVAIKTNGSNSFLLEDCTILSGDEEIVPQIDSYWQRANDLVWEHKLNELADFIKRNKRKPRHKNIQERKIHAWMVNNLEQLKHGKFSAERTRKFNSLGISSARRGLKRVV